MPQKPAAPVKVENAVKEGDLATVKLSPEAEDRLGIRTAPVEYTNATRTRTFGGEVVLPPDSVITVSAPVVGTILDVAAEPSAGMTVKKG
jgi:cobalt-zinc-cadmium efflux system membrane fusion protein